MTGRRMTAGQAQTVLAVDAVGDVTWAAYRDGTGPVHTPVTATVPSQVRTAATEIPVPARFLGRPLITLAGEDTDPAELVAIVLRRAAVAVACPDLSTVDALVLVHPADWTPAAQAALRRAGELAGATPTRVSLCPVPTDATGGDGAVVVSALGTADGAPVGDERADRGQRRSRWRATLRRVGRARALTAAVAVLLLVAGAGALTWSGVHGTGEGNLPEPATAERLEAFVGETGTFDCRNLYTSVAVRTVAEARLRSSLDRDRNIGTGTDDGETRCTPVYVGDRLTRKPLQVDVPVAEPIPGILSLGFRTYPDDNHQFGEPTTAEDLTEHRNWTLGTREVGNADGGKTLVRAATTTVTGHGTMLLFFPLGPDAGFEPQTGTRTEPDQALRQIIDGFEDTNLPATTGDSTRTVGMSDLLSDAAGHNDCSLIYDRVSVTDLASHEIRVPSAGDSVQLPSGGSGRMPTGEEDDSGRRICMLEPLGALRAVQVVTGASDGLPGNPVTGADDLAGWEEYWAFDPVILPADRTESGYQSYNLRHCWSDDDCVTVMVFSDQQADGGKGEQTRFAREPALEIARYLAGTDGQ